MISVVGSHELVLLGVRENYYHITDFTLLNCQRTKTNS